MAIKVSDGKYKCSYCNEVYPTPVLADKCLGEHDLVYVPIRRGDLARLIQFLYTKEERLLTEDLLRTLMNYNKLRGETK